METTIPFSGFYETLHAAVVGERLINEYGCDNEEHSKPEWTDIDSCNYDRCSSKATSEEYKAAEAQYCAEYVKNFSALIGIPLVYKTMTSPREYNFMTDRIFAEISERDVRMLRLKIDPVAIRKWVEDHFTSRDGFSSFYSGSYDEWLKQDKPFDHNQIGALLAVYASQVDAGWEMEVYEDTQGNF